MKRSAKKLLRYGKTVLRYDFQEKDGVSTVKVVNYEGEVWFILMKNGEYLNVQFLGRQ